MKNNLPPQNIEAEQVVLGAILARPELIHEATERITLESFYRPAHVTIYRAMQLISFKGTPVDLILLADVLKRQNELEKIGGPTYLAKLTDDVPAAPNFKGYLNILEDQRKRREIIKFAQRAMDDAANTAFTADEIGSDLEKGIFSLHQGEKEHIWVSAHDGVQAQHEKIKKQYLNRDIITGVATDFYDLDRKTMGFQPTDLIVIAGRPSMGKTAFGFQVGKNAALKYGHKVGFFSFEMAGEQLWTRAIACEAQVNSHSLASGFLSEAEMERVNAAVKVLGKANIYVDDSPRLPIEKMCSRARRICMEKGVNLLIADYLTKIKGPKADRNDLMVGEITASLKDLAKELKIPVIVLSQLNRDIEKRADRRPKMSDLRESGAIEQDADVVLLLYRDEYYNPNSQDKGLAEVIIGKQRNGPTGMVKLGFRQESTMFYNLERS